MLVARTFGFVRRNIKQNECERKNEKERKGKERYTVPSMVMEVSAILVAMTTLRTFAQKLSFVEI